MKTLQQRRLPLNTTFNTRDLGGYPTKSGKVTQWNSFLRSDDISYLNSADITFLKEYGITAVIDLRSEAELEKSGYTLYNQEDITIYHLPLNDGNVSDATKVTAEMSQDFLPHFYVQCLKQKEKIREIFLHIIDAPKGGLLFHCAAGKDRTGIVAALLLGLAEVSPQDILSDYEITYGYIKENPIFKQFETEFPESLLYSSRAYMEHALTYLEETYGSVENYFKALGFDKEQLTSLKMALTD